MRLLRSSASPRGSLRNALRFFGASAILDTDRNALPFLTRLGLESRRRADTPSSAAPQQISRHFASRHFARYLLDFCAAVLLYYARLRASARRQTIVRELIGSVKLLRVSRQSLSTLGRSKQFACCKAVVQTKRRKTSDGSTPCRESAYALPLFVFPSRLFLRSRLRCEREDFTFQNSLAATAPEGEDACVCIGSCADGATPYSHSSFWNPLGLGTVVAAVQTPIIR